MPNAPLIACHECDLLQREPALPAGAAARCGRCGALLYRNTPHGLDRTLAFTLAALVLFVIANLFPIVGLEVQGQHTSATLLGAVQALRAQEMAPLAGLVFLTTILAPALDLAAMSYLLLPLRLGRRPPGFTAVFRAVQALRPWGMVEVFMLGVLVAIVKLAHIASIVPGIALWSFAALILSATAAAASYDVHDLLPHLEAPR